MKFSAAAIGILLLFANCSKSKDSSKNSSVSYLKGKVEGVAFECNTAIQANRPQPFNGDTFLEISGTRTAGSITLTIDNGTRPVIAPGAYIFETSKYRNGRIWVDGGTLYFAGYVLGFGTLEGSGKITILEINSEYVKGNFEFTTKPDDITHIVKTLPMENFILKEANETALSCIEECF